MIAMAEGRFSVFSDGKGNDVRLETNEFGAITRRVDALGGEETFERDKNNNIINSRDKNGHITMSTYDDMGNLTSRVSPRESFKYAYMSDPSSNFHQPLSITDELERRTDFEYDDFGNVTKITDLENHITTFTYKNNYLLESSRNYATNTGQLYEYDANGNLTVIKDIFDRTLTTLTYDVAGNVLTQTNALGNTTTLTYDSMNRVLTQTDAKSGVLSFSYDAQGNQLSVNDKRGHTTSFEYDKMDRLTKRTNSLGHIESFSYDGNGNLIERSDRNGDIITYQYDALNRLTAKSYPDDTSESYTYDAMGNMLSAQDSDSSLTYTYDHADRVASVSTTGSLSQPDVTLTYMYGSNNNIVSLTDSITGNIRKIMYKYDNNNNLMRVGQSSSTDPHFVKLQYDSLQRITEVIYPNQILETSLTLRELVASF